MRYFLLVVILFSMAVYGKTLKVLTIGNSFADSAFVYLPKVVESVPDCSIIMNRANIGGCSLERHWNEKVKSEADDTYKPYQKKYNLRELLTLDTWDIITMQQASPLSFKPESYQPWFKNIYDFVRANAPQAEIVIQMTWSYRADNSTFTKGEVKDQNEMFDKLFEAYTAVAKEYNRRIIPTGLAVQLARANQPTPFKLNHTAADLAALAHPALPPEPDGSFIKGHYWTKNKDGSWKLSADLIHLNKRGEYLQACVWFAMLFGKKTSEITYAPDVITADDAQFLRVMAQKAVDEFKQVGTGKY